MDVDGGLTGPALFTLGEALAVFISDDTPSLQTASRYRRTVAGSETNVAVALTRLGLRTRLLTIVGSDGLGDAVESDLRKWGVDAVIGRSQRSTGVLVREPAAGLTRARAVNLRSASAATELSPDWVDAAWQPDPQTVFVTGITAVRSESARAAVEHAVTRGRETGALIVVDPNFRPHLAPTDAFTDALAGLRGRMDVAIGDLDELALLTGQDRSLAVRVLLDEGCRWVIVKRGPEGAVGYDGQTEIAVPSRAADVLDTVGAGDAFAAGVVAGLVKGDTLSESLERGATLAARVVATVGDIEGLPTSEDLATGAQVPHE
ncbi:sugar kinase [uncultured Microbacterium sp.]|uniref:sugar kinase n=1 Tax=uncultured Microbacterium sp. TaxID=191216 RepID=UPI0035CC7240